MTFSRTQPIGAFEVKSHKELAVFTVVLAMMAGVLTLLAIKKGGGVIPITTASLFLAATLATATLSVRHWMIASKRKFPEELKEPIVLGVAIVPLTIAGLGLLTQLTFIQIMIISLSFGALGGIGLWMMKNPKEKDNDYS